MTTSIRLFLVCEFLRQNGPCSKACSSWFVQTLPWAYVTKKIFMMCIHVRKSRRVSLATPTRHKGVPVRITRGLCLGAWLCHRCLTRVTEERVFEIKTVSRYTIGSRNVEVYINIITLSVKYNTTNIRS